MKKHLLLSGILTFQIAHVLAQNARVVSSSIWVNHNISVCWDNPTTQNKYYRDLVRKAVSDTWQKYSDLKFTDWCQSNDKDADIHIYINDERPHTIDYGKKLRHKPHGMVLNFSFNNWSQSCHGEDLEFCIKAIAVHEFGHALGFVHEQSRIECNFPCNKDEEDVKTGEGDWAITNCDLQSVMNYCNPQWNNSGYLSDLDIQAVQSLYGLPHNYNLLFSAFKANYKGLKKQFGSIIPSLSIVYNSSKIKPRNKTKKNMRLFKIYISGSTDSLNNIAKVIYNLGPKFNNQKLIATNRVSNFGIKLTAASEQDVKIHIYRKKPITKSGMVSLDKIITDQTKTVKQLNLKF